MTALLASVTNLEEARLAAVADVDLIDLKNPAQGALGALPLESIREICLTLSDNHPTSATIGDLTLQPQTVRQAVSAVGACGVNYVKIGLFPGGDLEGTLKALQPLTHELALIGVLFADYLVALPLLKELAAAGFSGVMLDTARKDKGSLVQLRPRFFLQRFVDQARELSLMTGLAGSLRYQDIPLLLDLKPDYLGFRGALCRQGQRAEILDASALAKIRATIPRQDSA